MMGTETVAKCIECGSSMTLWLYPHERLVHRHTSQYGQVLGNSGQWYVEVLA